MSFDPTTNTYCELDAKLPLNNQIMVSKETTNPSTGEPILNEISLSSFNERTISCTGPLIVWGGTDQAGKSEFSYSTDNGNTKQTVQNIVPYFLSQVIAAPDGKTLYLGHSTGPQYTGFGIGIYDTQAKTYTEGVVQPGSNPGPLDSATPLFVDNHGNLINFGIVIEENGFQEFTYDKNGVTINPVITNPPESSLYRDISQSPIGADALVLSLQLGTNGDPSLGNSPSDNVGSENIDRVNQDGTIIHAMDQAREKFSLPTIPPGYFQDGLFTNVVTADTTNQIVYVSTQAFAKVGVPTMGNAIIETAHYDPIQNKVGDHTNLTPQQGDGNAWFYQDPHPIYPVVGDAIVPIGGGSYTWNGNQELIVTLEDDNVIFIPPDNSDRVPKNGGEFRRDPLTGTFTVVSILETVTITPTATNTVTSTNTATTTPINTNTSTPGATRSPTPPLGESPRVFLPRITR